MSPDLPFDIIVLIIDIVGENKYTYLLQDLALVSQSFLQICSKHLFATVELHDAVPEYHIASSKKGFVKLLKSRPNVVKYIRKLTYKLGSNINNDDHLLSHILQNFLPTISRLNCLAITGSSSSKFDWSTQDSSLTSAFLHLMQLPTINHIDLSTIKNFPLSSLTPSVNLLRLDICNLDPINALEEDGSSEIVQSAMMPKIREFHTSWSPRQTTKLLHAKRQDGRPAFNFMDLKRLSMSFFCSVDERNIRYFLQNAKLLEKLHLSVEIGRSLVELHDILSPSARTLKVLELTVPLHDTWSSVFLGGLCEELEALAGHNMLEALSLKVHVDGLETEDFIGFIIQKVENVLVKPGWSALRQVSFKVLFKPGSRWTWTRDGAKLSMALQSLPDKYLSHSFKTRLYSAEVFN
jgi:hypothetical protein